MKSGVLPCSVQKNTYFEDKDMHNGQNLIFKNLLLLLLIVIPLFSLGISNHGLWSADEPRVAEIGREMAITGNWAVPMLNEKPFLEQPPLYYASLALAFKAFGVSDTVARIPSAVFALAGVLAVFFVANLLFGPRIALFSGFILATTGEYFRVAHWVIVDGALACFVLWAMYFFLRGYLANDDRKKLLHYSMFYLFCTFAFYVKGFIGIILPGLAVFVFLAFEKNLRELIRMRFWLGFLIFIAATLPWFIALWQQGGAEHLKVFFLHNHLQRFLPAGMAGKISGASSGHHNPFYYYLKEFPVGFLPWSILLVPSLYFAFSKTGLSHEPSGKGRLFAKCWFFTGIIFLSLASTKRTLYLMPIFAPVSMLTAYFIDYTIACAERPKFLKVTTAIFTRFLDVLLLVIGVGLVPVYLYCRTRYLPDASSGLFATIIVTSLVVTILSCFALKHGIRNITLKYWSLTTVNICFIFAFMLVALFPILDRHKTFVPFCRGIARTVPADTALYAYKPDETLRGAVPFYTGRFLVETEDGGKNLCAAGSPCYVIIRDRRGVLENELFSGDSRLQVVSKQVMGTDRALVLFSNRPAPKKTAVDDAIGKIEKKTGTKGRDGKDAGGL